MIKNDTHLTRCPVCNRALRIGHYGRPRRYCSDACKQCAYRARVDGLQAAQNSRAYAQYGVTK